MTSMKKTLLSVMLLSSATAFGDGNLGARLRSVCGRVKAAATGQHAALVATGGAVALVQQGVKLPAVINRAVDKVASLLGVDRDTATNAAMIEFGCQAAKIVFGDDKPVLSKVVHGVRSVNGVTFLANNAHVKRALDIATVPGNAQLRLALCAAVVAGLQSAKGGCCQAAPEASAENRT